MSRITVAIVAGSAGDWGGASRVLYTNLKLLDLEKIRPIVLLPKKGPIIPELEDNGIEYVIWGDLTELADFPNSLKTFWKTLNFLRKEKVDLVHVNQADAWRPVELATAHILRIPVLVHLHTADDNPSPYVKQASAILAVSDYVARTSSSEIGPKYIVLNPVDITRFHAARDRRFEWGYSEREILVSFVGQIREIKGVGDFIAMGHLLDDQDIRFLIAGECRDSKQFVGAYSEADLQKAFADDARFRYLGYLDRVEDLYRTTDIVVMPSRWQEPLGLIGIEAGACGKPVVATRSGGIPEVVAEGETGFLADIGDVEKLAECVRKLANDPDLRRSMGEAALKRVENNFTSAPMRDLEAVYERIVSR